MNINVDEKRLADLIRQVVSGVLDEKLTNFKIQLIPPVDDDEMAEIESNIGSPVKYNNQEYEKLDI